MMSSDAFELSVAEIAAAYGLVGNETKPRDSSRLSQKQLTFELEKRGIKPRGFYLDDVRTLQASFNQEFDELITKRNTEEIALKEQREQEANSLKQKKLSEQEQREEDEAISANDRISFWMDLVHKNSAPQSAVLKVDNVLARACLKALWDNTSVGMLDLSQNELTDDIAPHIQDMIERNKGLVSVLLDRNKFKANTLAAISEGLKRNDTLKLISLSDNNISGNRRDYSGVRAFGECLKFNRTLKTINLCRCNLGSEGGKTIADAFENNTTTLIFEITGNNCDVNDLKRIGDKLQDNKKQYAIQVLAKKESIKRELELEKEEAEQKAKELKAIEDEEWLAEEKTKREEARAKAQARKQRQLREEVQAREDAEKRRQDEEKRKLAEASSKKKKGKGKKGKKK
eukprot:TRINITY_DN782380_c0_g1_i1.p1 TRINITY_DN782380_c0_g1~~TRINITY_DN782380_c0_g1_i1.p1  ORF type:complete len:401 (-),score=149.57 TRINITY_DN782380_c0_g1_i1:174-1376(-)